MINQMFGNGRDNRIVLTQKCLISLTIRCWYRPRESPAELLIKSDNAGRMKISRDELTKFDMFFIINLFFHKKWYYNFQNDNFFYCRVITQK